MANVDLVDDGQDDEDNQDQEVGGVGMVGGVEKVNEEAWEGGPPGLGGRGHKPEDKPENRLNLRAMWGEARNENQGCGATRGGCGQQHGRRQWRQGR